MAKVVEVEVLDFRSFDGSLPGELESVRSDWKHQRALTRAEAV